MRNKNLLQRIAEFPPKSNDRIVKYLTLNPETNSLPKTLHLKIIRRHVNDSNIKNQQEGLNRIGVRVPKANVTIVCNVTASTNIPSRRPTATTTAECPGSQPTLKSVTNCPTGLNSRSTTASSEFPTFDMFCDTRTTGSVSVLHTAQKEEKSTVTLSTSCKKDATFGILNPFRNLFNGRNKTSVKTTDNGSTVSLESSKTSVGLATVLSSETTEQKDECETRNTIESTTQCRQSKSTERGIMKTKEFQITKQTEVFTTRKSETPFIDVSYIKTMNPTDNPQWFSPPKPCGARPHPLLPSDLEIKVATTTTPTVSQPILRKFVCNLRKTTSSPFSTRLRNKNKLKSFTSAPVVHDNRVHLHVATVFPTKLYVPLEVQMGRRQKTRTGRRNGFPTII